MCCQSGQRCFAETPRRDDDGLCGLRTHDDGRAVAGGLGKAAEVVGHVGRRVGGEDQLRTARRGKVQVRRAAAVLAGDGEGLPVPIELRRVCEMTVTAGGTEVDGFAGARGGNTAGAMDEAMTPRVPIRDSFTPTVMSTSRATGSAK